MNPYFDLTEPQPVADVEGLLSLNTQKTYFRPGDQTRVEGITNIYSSPYSTAGIFRGQLHDWPLIPKCFRNVDPEKTDMSKVVRSFRWFEATAAFKRFCDRAEIQNPAFPTSVADRLSIAQHFGVPTPLLDWSQNIFAAVFFAVRDVFSDAEFEETMRVFVYHVVDERLFGGELPHESDLSDFGRSAFVKPYHIDRRIERQRAVFSYHPHPAHRPAKIPVRTYFLEWPVIHKMLELMKGFGFTEDYFFPDYAGIARAVVSKGAV
jgi:hypothetical protein